MQPENKEDAPTNEANVNTENVAQSTEKTETENQNNAPTEPVQKKKTRCKNWPNCNDPNCLYTHPTETVSLFNVYF